MHPLVPLLFEAEAGHGDPSMELLLVFLLLIVVWGAFRVMSRRSG